MTDSALRELADDPSSRKRFFKMMGGAGAVSAFGIVLAACGDDDDKDAADKSEPLPSRRPRLPTTTRAICISSTTR